MSRSFLVDSLIGNNTPPSYPLPYYAGNQLPNYMFNLFNLGLGYHPVRPVPRPPVLPVPVPLCGPQTMVGLPMSGQSPPSPINTSVSRLSGNYHYYYHYSVICKCLGKKIMVYKKSEYEFTKSRFGS